MTRINLGIKPAELTTKHLIAEHRELKRIPNLIKKGKLNCKDIPPTFRLGKGHVIFFSDKLLYLKKRYEELYSECLKRSFKVEYYGASFNDLPPQLLNDYEPTENDIQIIRERINSKLKKN
jgi:deoxyribonuclease (pyrimidine dimer)